MDGLHTVKLYGHEYTVEVIDGKITRIGCKGRWPLAPTNMVNDEWLFEQLGNALDLNND